MILLRVNYFLYLDVKKMLTKLSLEEEDRVLNQTDIDFREQVVRSIQ